MSSSIVAINIIHGIIASPPRTTIRSLPSPLRLSVGASPLPSSSSNMDQNGNRAIFPTPDLLMPVARSEAEDEDAIAQYLCDRGNDNRHPSTHPVEATHMLRRKEAIIKRITERKGQLLFLVDFRLPRCEVGHATRGGGAFCSIEGLSIK